MGKGKWVRASERDPISWQPANRWHGRNKRRRKYFSICRREAAWQEEVAGQRTGRSLSTTPVGDKYKWNKSKAAVPPSARVGCCDKGGYWLLVTKGTFYGSCCVSYGAANNRAAYWRLPMKCQPHTALNQLR